MNPHLISSLIAELSTSSPRSLATLEIIIRHCHEICVIKLSHSKPFPVISTLSFSCISRAFFNTFSSESTSRWGEAITTISIPSLIQSHLLAEKPCRRLVGYNPHIIHYQLHLAKLWVASSLLPLLRSHDGLSGMRARRRMGRIGMRAPGKVVSLHGRPQPRMYISRLPVSWHLFPSGWICL